MQDEQRRIAFDIFYAEHAAPVYRFALRLCGNAEDAEDLAAQALTQAFRKWSGYRGDSSPRLRRPQVRAHTPAAHLPPRVRSGRLRPCRAQR